MVVIVKSEGAAHPPLFRSGACLGVGNVSPGILALEFHVHHIFLFLYVAACQFALLRAFVIYLYVFDGEVGQVFEHHLVVAFEEVFAVEQQIVYLLAVHVYVTVVLNLRSGHLADKSVEHLAVGQIECRRVVDDGVAAVGYLHARALDHQLVEVAAVHAVVAVYLH